MTCLGFPCGVLGLLGVIGLALVCWISFSFYGVDTAGADTDSAERYFRDFGAFLGPEVLQIPQTGTLQRIHFSFHPPELQPTALAWGTCSGTPFCQHRFC